MQNFVIRTYDAITIANCYNEICGDEAQARRQKRIMFMVSAALVLAGVLSFLVVVPALRIAGFWLLIIGIGMLFAPMLKRKNLKRLEAAAKDTLYTFTEDGWILFEDGEHERHDYSEFIRLAEDEHAFILHTSRVSACFLPKADFSEGDAAAFAEFIIQKTGLPMKRQNRR